MLRQIEQEIEEIEIAIAKVKTKLASVFLEYTQALAQTVQQQLILSVFQLCTHDRPEAFLSLSLSDRQKLQKDLQILAKSAVENVNQVLGQSDPSSLTDQEMVDRALTSAFLEVSHTANQLLVKANILKESDSEATKSEESKKIHLRPSEVEFTSRDVMSHRGELRVLSAKWHQLHSELEKKRQAKIVAEAEQAWRSTWMEQ
ncbi:hypothetical protein V2H45_10095 [Tumidithrix elongata RA019]|uniref:Uncharacterized protein n=1 Tax=Tumidithrix elongata BACA0141 TaxID=2716417 RepID=A0AAW9Q391_9CYAN|nr:hypothetical protein [Tumidithrix elongata RA019]